MSRQFETLGDWVLNNIGAVIIGMLGVAAILLILSSLHERNKKAEFMDECLKYQKQYECTALWRRSESTPIYIPMPMR